MKDGGVDPFQVVPALVVIAIAGGGGEVGGVDPVLLHGAEDLGLVVLGGAVDVREAVPEALQRRLPVSEDLGADAQGLINGLQFHERAPSHLFSTEPIIGDRAGTVKGKRNARRKNGGR